MTLKSFEAERFAVMVDAEHCTWEAAVL